VSAWEEEPWTIIMQAWWNHVLVCHGCILVSRNRSNECTVPVTAQSYVLRCYCFVVVLVTGQCTQSLAAGHCNLPQSLIGPAKLNSISFTYSVHRMNPACWFDSFPYTSSTHGSHQHTLLVCRGHRSKVIDVIGLWKIGRGEMWCKE
jgi:hypothetical protein